MPKRKGKSKVELPDPEEIEASKFADSKADKDLFFVDTVGTYEGKKHQKRLVQAGLAEPKKRKRSESVASAPSSNDTGVASAGGAAEERKTAKKKRKVGAAAAPAPVPDSELKEKEEETEQKETAVTMDTAGDDGSYKTDSGTASMDESEQGEDGEGDTSGPQNYKERRKEHRRLVRAKKRQNAKFSAPAERRKVWEAVGETQLVETVKEKEVQGMKRAQETAHLVAEGVAALPKKPGAGSRDPKTGLPVYDPIPEPVMDIWGDEYDSAQKQKAEAKKINGYEVAPILPSTQKVKRKLRLPPEPAPIKPLVAHPGLSFHPDAESHQKLLEKALEIDQKEEAEREAINKKLRGEIPIEPNPLLPKEDDPANQIEEATPADRAPPERRLTKQERKKKARIKAMEKLKKAKEKEKELRIAYSQLGAYKKQLKQQEEEAKKRKAELEEKKKNPNKPPRLGPLPLKEDFPEIRLTSELDPSLKNVKPSKLLVYDQFKRFQEKALIEPRKRKKQKPKYGRRYVERYKDPA